MEDSLSHTKYKCYYHIAFIPKYRKKVLFGQIRESIKEIIKKLCAYKHVEILSGYVCIDHVHLVVSIPPKMSVSEFVGYLKGKSALMIHDMYPNLFRKYDKSFWARGYFVGTVGDVTKSAAIEYVRSQEAATKEEELRGRGNF